jgi:hypothetical protein
MALAIVAAADVLSDRLLRCGWSVSQRRPAVAPLRSPRRTTHSNTFSWQLANDLDIRTKPARS